MARTEATESEIQSAILDYLSARGHLAIRLNNQPIYDPKRKLFRALPKHTPAGLADIVVVDNGYAIFLEVKRPRGKQSDDQIHFQRRVFRADGQYHVVHSIDEVQ